MHALRKARASKRTQPQQQSQKRKQQQDQQQQQQQVIVMPETDIALVVGRAAWWQPFSSSVNNNNNNDSNNKQRHKGKRNGGGGGGGSGNSNSKRSLLPLKLSFADALKDFLRHVSFHCYGKLVEPNRRFEERFFWLVFHVAALSVLISFLWNHYDNERPALSTSIYNQLYPVEKVAFPAISICSVNRVSNTSVYAYAKNLNERDPQKRGTDFFYRNLFLFSNLYFTIDNINLDELLEFQSFLDIYDTDDSELYYNTRHHMQMLTPDCGHILVQCRLAGVDVSCAKEFTQTLTSEGFCCTFNAHGRYARPRRFSMRLFGSDLGLQVLLNASREDYFYRYHRVHGFKLLVYTHSNQPQISSSGVSVLLSQTASDTHLKLRPRILEADDELRNLNPRVRNCLFEDELSSDFTDGYSYNKCITRCRTHSILALCHCVKFQAPYEQLQIITKPMYCTLRHIQCLRRYRFKWLNVITRRQFVEGLEREMEDSLYCPDCLPSCSETTYDTNLLVQPLNVYNLRSYPNEFRDDVINNNDNHTDLALLSVYFAEPHAPYFRQILKNSWLEVFSNIGGICGIITGFSLIGIGEVIFFMCQHLYAAFKDELLAERQQQQKQQRHQQNKRTILQQQHIEPLLILP